MLYLLYNIYINLTIKINFMQKMNMSKFQCYSTIKESKSKKKHFQVIPKNSSQTWNGVIS